MLICRLRELQSRYLITIIHHRSVTRIQLAFLTVTLRCQSPSAKHISDHTCCIVIGHWIFTTLADLYAFFQRAALKYHSCQVVALAVGYDAPTVVVGQADWLVLMRLSSGFHWSLDLPSCLLGNVSRFVSESLIVCKEFIEALELCHADTWAKWTGGCNQAKVDLNNCLKQDVCTSCLLLLIHVLRGCL